MIVGATRGAGGKALGAHLSATAHNEQVTLNESRGLISEDIKAQIDELTGLGSHARTKTPLYHVHLDPPENKPLSESERFQYWENFEKEFNLEDRPFASISHLKNGREHEHRVYLAIKDDGKAIRFDFNYQRHEKLNRLFELQRGEELTKGAHNKAVIFQLEKEGKADIAQQLREAGIDQGPKPIAISPTERHQQERTGINKADVAQSVLSCWQQSDDGKSFLNALKENNLTLAHGQKCDVIIDQSGNSHALSRLLNLATKENGIEKIDSAQIVERIAYVEIPTVKTFQEFRQSLPVSTSENPKQDNGKTEVKDSGNHPTQAPVSGGGGAHQAPQASTQAPQANKPMEATDGPGEPPGPGATPEQVAQYRKRLYEYEAKKAQQAEAMRKAMARHSTQPTPTQQGGVSHGPTKEQQQAGIEIRERVASFFSKPQASDPRPERVEPSHQGTATEGKRDPSPSGERPQGAQSDSVQRHRVGSQYGQPVAVAGLTGTKPSREHDQPENSGPSDGSKRNLDADRKKVAFARIQERRFEQALNTLLTPEKVNLLDKMISRLKERPTVESEIKRNVGFIQNKIKSVVDTNPINDNRELDRDYQTEIYTSGLYDKIKERKNDFAYLAQKVESARSQIPAIAKFLPWKLEAELKADKIAERLEKLESKIGNLDYADSQKIADGGQMGAHLAFKANESLQAWQRKPEVVQAIQTKDLIGRASDSALKGDPTMQRLLLENRIKEALELQRKRDEAQKEIMARNTQKTDHRNGPNQSAAKAAPSGPRFR